MWKLGNEANRNGDPITVRPLGTLSDGHSSVRMSATPPSAPDCLVSAGGLRRCVVYMCICSRTVHTCTTCADTHSL